MSALPLSTAKVSGSSALKTQLEATLTANDAGLEFTIQGGATSRWNGTSFDQVSTGGAALMTDGALASGPIYQDATYKYFGEALPGTALTAASWRVSRMTISNSRIEWADGNGNLDNVFTDLTTVAALSFS